VFFGGTGLSIAGAWLVKLRSTSSINPDAVPTLLQNQAPSERYLLAGMVKPEWSR
jgi:hypothetical protein